MLYDLTAVKANIRNREGKRVFYQGEHDRLTPSARDYLAQERIAVLPAEQARPNRYRLVGGGYIDTKPEHMTHLNADLLVPKTHPRIAFRGAIDTLEAELLLCQASCQPKLKEQLGQILELVRKIMRWDVLEEPAQEVKLCGLTEEEIRSHSHRPQDYYGIPHFMPGVEDKAVVLQLNRVRCVSRQAELAGVAAFTDGQGNPTRTDILRLLNRISSMIYILMIQEKAS